MSRVIILVLLWFSSVLATNSVNSSLPNVILIVTDDQDVVLKGMVSCGRR